MALTDDARTLEFQVTGMTCAGCAANVQRAIERLPGIRDATVSLDAALARVAGADLDPDAIVRAIEGRGFGATPVTHRPDAGSRRSAIEARQHAQAAAWKRRAIIGIGLWIPLEALHWLAPHGSWMGWVMLVGSTIVLLAAGGGFFRSALAAARRATTNMDTLISIGAFTAWGFSLVVFIAQRFGALMTESTYFAEAAALLGIISLGHWLEARTSARAGSAVRELLELQPDRAERLDDAGEPESVDVADVRAGDRLLIRPGARIPVDGVVVEGRSDVDESVVTGESMPVTREPGGSVVAGSMNATGRLVVEAAVAGTETTIARIADLVQRAQSSKADIQRLADRVSAVFVPTVLIIAAVTVIGWWIAGDLTRGLLSAVTVLVISCPCALGLATPMAVMVGAGAASRRGILVKSAQALERAGRATRVVFDKTGTITRGMPTVASIAPSGGRTDDELLRLAAAVERPSEHPVARAIVAAARSRGIELPPVTDFEALPGVGVRGIVEGRRVTITRGRDVACAITVDDVEAGAIDVRDEPRDDAAEAIGRLRALGLEVRMLTGDRRDAAEAIGRAVGLDGASIIAEATPESKQQVIRDGGPGTIMVGDGINDAAALALADLGIAMASGTNIAIESADVVIPGRRVTAVGETVEIARATLRTIRQNLFFAFFYNGLAIPVAAFGLLGTSGPIIAAAAMGLSDVTVIGNALRLKASLRRRD